MENTVIFLIIGLIVILSGILLLSDGWGRTVVVVPAQSTTDTSVGCAIALVAFLVLLALIAVATGIPLGLSP